LSQPQSFNIYLVRHQKVSGPPGLYGHTDIGVVDELQSELAMLISKQLSFERLYSSPLIRCKQCAMLVAAQANLNLELIEGFKEFNFGTYDGVAFDLFKKEQWPILERFWSNPMINPLPNAESIADFRKRIVKAFEIISNKGQADSLVICHGGVIRVLIAEVLGLDISNSKLFSNLSIKNGSLTKLSVTHYKEFDTPHISIEYIGKELK
jgi:alpha-ribazole phosphatase